MGDGSSELGDGSSDLGAGCLTFFQIVILNSAAYHIYLPNLKIAVFAGYLPSPSSELPSPFLFRHRSEQYLTSSQQSSHFLRQVKGR